MDPEQIDRPGRHVEPAEPEAPNVEQNPSDYELRFDGNQSTEVSSPAKVAESEDHATRDHSGPPLQNLEAEGSDEEAVVQLEPDVEGSDEEADVQLEPDVEGSDEEAVVQLESDVEGSDEEAVVQLEPDVEGSDEEADVQLEPAEVESSGDEADAVQLEPAEVESSVDEADVGQLEPAGVGSAAEVIVVQQVSIDEESSRASSLEEESHPDEDGAEEPRRINFEDIRRRNPLLVDNIARVFRALRGEGVGEWVAAGQAAIGNLHRGVHALEAAAVNLRDVMVGVGEREAAGQAAIANLHRGAHALEAVAVHLRDAMVAMEAGFGIGADDNPAADPA